MQTQKFSTTETKLGLNCVNQKESVLVEKYILKVLAINAVIALVVTSWMFTQTSMGYDFEKVFSSLENWYNFCGWLALCLTMVIVVFGGLTLMAITALEKFENWKELNIKKTILF